ncbi:ABC1 kinase family protein [Sulfurirhabdus autotrophica]|uniref:2-octaprenylphenol hydroxylase n=1 Tax=Sulfurirhabdus autotrophica TaxID=1706046 RepID=A0A4R3YE52_9PROT|nr:AarF/UbiB family protein [Sulfurirhabdus autotrophica]TCV90356.1 2-octaprenylphenol hydroxylase [Sulfurirhabdus autotrophica]
MLWETINVMRDISRLHDITSVMIRYGGGDFVRLIGIGNILERAGRILHWKEASEISQLEPAVRVRRALEELGPAFVKLGQVLATRVDIFPPNWIAEFEKLQSEVPPVPFEDLLPDLQKILGKAPDEIFRDLNAIPFAAASIAQVHLAKLQDGTPVVLKIRRPGIESVIEADLRILAHLARLIESEIPESRRYQPSQVVSQFKRSLRRELDFAMEARNIDRFRNNFQDDPTVVVPQVYWEYTSEIMNVQEAIQGIPGTNLKKVDESGLDRKLLAARGADAVLKMIMIHGYFHADPHPGNVFYLPENRIGIIDFGMVGRITDYRRNQIVNLLYALAKKDEEGMLDVLMDWTGDGAVNETKLATDVSEFVFNFDNVQLKDLRLGPLLSEITVIMRENGLVLPSDLTLLFKALITLEGLGQQLDPEFHMLEHLTPFVRSVITERYKPAALLKRGQHGLKDLMEIATALPRDLAKLLREARRGKLKIDLDLKRLDHFGSQLDRSTNRLTLGILTASLVIGSSIVMTVKGGPTVFGLPLFGLLGFFVAFLNSIWIIFSIWRSGKE